jgi:hypothetical protein
MNLDLIHIYLYKIKIKSLIDYLKDFINDDELDTKSNNSNNIPEPKVDSYIIINGYKLPVNNTDSLYNNSYVRLILYLILCSTIITIVWYNGETIKEWSIYTTSVTAILSIISKIFGKNLVQVLIVIL